MTWAYQRERANQALVDAQRRLKEAGLDFREHRRVEEPGRFIAEIAARGRYDLVVMGARRLGTHTGEGAWVRAPGGAGGAGGSR